MHQLIRRWISGLSVLQYMRKISVIPMLQILMNWARFATADTRVTYQATPEFSVQAKLANMFDKEYSTNYSNSTLYNQDGRTAWVTLPLCNEIIHENVQKALIIQGFLFCCSNHAENPRNSMKIALQ